MVLGGIFGLIFVFLFPPFQIIDEPSHFFRSYQLAEGHIIGQEIGGQAGGTLPLSVWDTVGHYTYLIFHYEQKAHLGVIKQDLIRKLNPDQKGFGVFNNTVIYPPITYAPQAIAIRISLFFKASPLVSLYMARLASLTLWLTVMYLVIRMVPIGKWAFLVLGLFPMVLAQAGSVSADATINSLCFLAVGLTLKAIYTKQLSRNMLIALSGVGLALALTKIPYFFVMLFVLAIPRENFPATMRKLKFVAVLFSAMLVFIGLWSLVTLRLHVDLRPDTSVVRQAHFLLHDPLALIYALFIYPFTLQMDGTFTQLYGLLGWNEIRLPLWLIFSAYITLALTLFEPTFKKIAISTRTRIIAYSTTAITAIAITMLIYLSWMPVGFKYIYDLWGRYFSAFTGMVVPAMGGVLYLERKSWDRLRLLLPIFLAFSLIVVTVFIWNRYYFHFRLGYKFIEWLDA